MTGAPADIFLRVSLVPVGELEVNLNSICMEKNWEQERKTERIQWKRHQKESDKEQVEERNNLIVIATTIIQQACDTHIALKDDWYPHDLSNLQFTFH